ncbi:DUF1707 SHOCT-like domain-containing protein [Streptomyces genisteinicus]|uniref:DUF1707 and DUF2154 domain-containing protein n=1 Tax=Streptomyces genisteinicus TaxID=2768068 RepID=A0A7H0HM62_9ACTN|nr:DUF1707 domain-containing protein [Streptomyces genisteinicus]QNP61628.1 DUF1707 and DUF2154 domain-containing protein [Streptomyces genisteinicus]
MSLSQDDPRTPVAEHDRDAALRRVRDAYGQGQLDHEELDARIQRVLTARTRGDLGPALAALPAEPDTAVTLSAAVGRIRRGRGWRVPRTLTVASAFGKVRLDLSRAVLEHPVVDIELQLGAGSARIIVPRDAVVELDSVVTAMKDTRYRARTRTGADGPAGPRIRITGTLGLGRLTVRHARR